MAGVPIEFPCIRLPRALSVLLAVALLGTSAPSQTPTQTPTTADTVLEVRVTGNETVPTAKVMAQLQTRAGREFDESLVQRDVRNLATLGWFIDVEPLYRREPGGRIVVFRVTERRTLRYVEYLGHKKVKEKLLAKETGLKVGDAIDPYAIDEGRRKIEQFYRDRGFNKVRVTLLEGNKPNDRGAIYMINEGQPQKIWDVNFVGNTIVSDGRLRKAVINSKPGWFRVFKGYVDPQKIDEDVDRITAYYRSLGYFRAEVGRIRSFSENGRWLTLTFVINEGLRYEVRNLSFLGNSRVSSTDLAEKLRLKDGQFFNKAAMDKDVNTLKDLYGSQGYVFANVTADPRFLGTDQPGMLDLVYKIDEGERYRVGRIIVNIRGDNPHTRIQTVLNRISLHPGDIVDITKIRNDERRLAASQLFARPPTGAAPKIVLSPPEFNDTEVANSGHTGSFRGQSPDTNDRLIDIHIYGEPAPRPASQDPRGAEPLGNEQPLPPPIPIRSNEKLLIRGQSPPASGWQYAPVQQPPQYGGYQVGGLGPDSPSPSGRLSQPASGATRYNPNPSPQATYPQARYAQVPGAPLAGQPPATTTSPPPSQYVQGGPLGPLFPGPAAVGPPVNGPPVVNDSFRTYPDPYGGLTADPTIPLVVELEEGQTGRFALGAGITSDAGVIGSIVIDEQNFDWRRFPTSWSDLSTAFRGNGERFRMEALPGTEVQRYLINFQNPYLFDTRISLGLSGFYFDRRFIDWDEQRVGGRVSLGYQLGPDLSTTFAYRGEDVTISRPRDPTVGSLAETVGHNTLHGFRGTLTHNTRDSAFLATTGHFIELAFEQVVGDFVYPKADIDIRQYFLLRERPDGSGRHVIGVSLRLGVAGGDTPVYDHFFAGGFSTLRGFDFRGASPVAGGTTVGGEFLWINSVEYLMPITADDMLQAVVFCDFGTVENRVNIDDFRVVPGIGLRVTVPALGPAPIALDFGFPVAKAVFDDTQVFSFNIGFLRN